MSDVLARIRVKETHGIRRFLYPLSAVPRLKGEVDIQEIGLFSSDGETVPMQIAPTLDKHGGHYRMDFALSLTPHSEQILLLRTEKKPVAFDDPLQVTRLEGGGIRNDQKRFSITVDADAGIQNVVYDGIPHLRGRSAIFHNGSPITEISPPTKEDHLIETSGYLCEVLSPSGCHADGWGAGVETQITACKSWAQIRYWSGGGSKPLQAGDEITFRLPLAVTSPTLTYDFGFGNGIYGKLQSGVAEEVIWQTEFGRRPYARWSVAVGGRTDYVGEAATAAIFQPQRWFHLVDSDKALAVAITRIPPACQQMKATINIAGDIDVVFRMEKVSPYSDTFSVCYHFLNDVPAIAAATNPQSILLPPTVEVLPT